MVSQKGLSAVTEKVKEWVENRPAGPTVALQEQATTTPRPKSEASPALEAAKRRSEELEEAVADLRRNFSPE